jgi:phosphoribulokinase
MSADWICDCRLPIDGLMIVEFASIHNCNRAFITAIDNRQFVDRQSSIVTSVGNRQSSIANELLFTPRMQRSLRR